MDGVCPSARLVPGADWYQNVTRLFVPRGLVVHTTQGHDSRGLLGGRHHNSPGTCQYLIHGGELLCYYPDNVRCSHAAGANYAMTGCEIDMYTGESLAPADSAALKRLADYHSGRWGWDRAIYMTGDPRVYIDRSWYRGAIAHRGVDYPADRSLWHFDQIETYEWPQRDPFFQPIQEFIDVEPVYTIDKGTFYKWNYDKKDWETVGVSPGYPVLTITLDQYHAYQTARSPGDR